jgi:leucyl aminopeptidase
MKINSSIILLLSILLFSKSLLAETDKQAWISIGSEALDYLNNQKSYQVDINQINTTSSQNSTRDKVSILSIPESQLSSLSELMHDKFNRCGGFFYHESKTKAIEFNNKSASQKIAQPIDYTINNADTVTSLINQISIANLESTITNLSNYNNRYYQAESGVISANSIHSSWQNISNGRSDISVALENHSNWMQPSVIATITGTSLSDEFVLVGGHLDSINSRLPQYGRATGAEDNASGIAVVTELLNMIVSSDYRPSRTLVLIGYAAEEVGLRGSQAIANRFNAENKNVVGVVQFDMTSFQGTNDTDIVFVTDFTNAAQNQFMADLIDTYLPGISYGYDVCGYACSDHASWNNLGYPASFPFESTFNDHNNTIHTNNDTAFNVNHVMKFTQLAAAYTAELAKGEVASNSASGAIQFSTTSTQINGGNEVSLTVNRIEGLDASVSVDYTTINDTAVAGTDYTATSGTLTWDDQDNSDKTITVSTNTTSVNKSFSVLLSNPQGGVVLSTQNSAVVTILLTAPTPNDDPTPTASSGGGVFQPIILFLLLVFGYRRRLTNS